MSRGFASFSAAVLVLLFAAAQVAGASTVASRPLPVQSASLTQNGRQLVWQLRTSHPFSPGALARDRRTLCLLVERADSGSIAGQLCLAGPRKRQRVPQLLYASVTGGVSGRARAIAATITRASDRELTASFLPSAIGVTYKPLSWQVSSTLAPPACTAPATGIPPAGACQILFPAHSALLKLHTPELVGCVASGTKWVFQGPSNVREIALTFDDGPWDEPPSIDFVKLLARYHVPATFFEIGDQISEYDRTGKIEREMLADGDMIGDHTWTHPDMLTLSPSEQRAQLAMTAAAIKKATGFEPCLFRAPYGDVDPELLNLAWGMGFATIQWDIDPRDWALPGESEIIDNVVSNARDGGIVEEHFGGGPRYETLDALPTEISELRARGYKFVTLTQMLGYKLIYK